MSEPNGKQNIVMVTSILSVVGMFIAGAWVIIDLKSENTVLKATVSQREAIADLQGRFTTQDALFASKLTEIETQFRAEDQLRNVQWADMRRTLALLWGKTYGTPYPTEVQFYPSIAQPSK